MNKAPFRRTRSESTQDIQDRMYREAASIYERYTGRRLTSLEGFDPLVYMLLGACASEFERISQEKQSAWARLLEHVAQLLIPESHIGPLPASAVLHARPGAGSGAIFTHPENMVFLPDHQGREAFFSPTGKYPLCEGSVAYMASGDTLFQVDGTLEKTRVARTLPGKVLPLGSLWIGIALAQTGMPKSLRLFFDLKQRGALRYIGPILQSARWFFGEQELASASGLEPRDEMRVRQHLHPSEKLEQEAEGIFADQFVRLHFGEVQENYAVTYPPEWESHFDPSALKMLREPLVWIRASFSPAFFPPTERADSLLAQSICLLNCFPVLNRRLHEMTFRLSDKLNLFALETNNLFFGVEGVLSSQLQKSYQEKPFLEIYQQKAPQADTSRIYAIRKEGVNRFDSRDASALINNLMRYFREESYIFSAMGKDMLTQNINALEKALNDIENKIREHQQKQQAAVQEPPVYIAFPPPGQSESVIVRFWSTRGLAGNHIPSGSALELYSKDVAWQKGSIRFVTGSEGGRNHLGEMDRLYAFKSALITRGKIVTREDIKSYCQEHLGERIRKVEIKAGVLLGKEPKQGLIRSLEVHLYPAQADAAQADFWHFTEQKLERNLNAASTQLTPIRVLTHLS